jgi:hypothetical protein
MKCPREDCNGELIYFSENDEPSLLLVGIWKFYCCDECGGEFRFKVLKEKK